MKKMMFLIIGIILFSVSLYALTGKAYITPEKVARSYFSETIEITYNAGYGTNWLNGEVELVIPEKFPDLPSLTAGARGEIKVYYLRGGTTEEPIANSNILIDGRAITITAINLTANDLLKIIYGTKDNGGGGVQTPSVPGTYYFLMYENPTGSTSFIPLDEQPSIEVTMIDLKKTANVTSVMAKNTFTFILTYKNISDMYPVNEVVLWDTLPQGLSFLYASITPTVRTGNYLSWSLGMLSNNISDSLQIVVEAQPGIIAYGQRLTNTAKMQASESTYTYLQEAEVSIDVFGVKLSSSIYAMPSSVSLDGFITVLMNVQNQGNYHAYNVSPSALTINGTGSVTKISGPEPEYISMLSSGQSTTFTWIYKATGAGSIYFIGRSIGQENTLTVESNTANSNPISISLIIPTSTQTPVITFTTTPAQTKTFTMTDTPTQEMTITATPTSTDTEIFTITPTFTNTSTVSIDTPTFVKTIIPTPTFTPDVSVFIDKNYFNPEKGENIKIYYKILAPGIVDIKIFNLSGEIINSYSKKYSNATYDYLYWDGKNNAGKYVGRGIYFITVKQQKENIIKKVFVLK